MKTFPKDFLWGAATSSHQVEGGNTNNWSEWEKKTAEERAKHIPNWYKFPENLKKVAEDPKYRVSGKASNSFNMWKEDIKVLKELGLNSYRFSVEWSRIFPQKGVVSEEGLSYYKELIMALKRNNIEPVLTCWHWTLPLWLTEEGGLMAKNIEEYFREYFEVLAENFGKDVKYWITINEPEVVTLNSYFFGTWPPAQKNIFKALYLYYFKLTRIHKIGYRVIKNINPNAMVSIAKQNAVMVAYNKNPLNILIAKGSNFFWNKLFLRLVRKELDYIGLNFYFCQKMGIMGIRNDNDKLSDLGWWMRPDTLYEALMELKEFNLPIVVTENGLADAKDIYRAWWLDETFKAMHRALDSGVNLIGYMHWSLIDNFEWAEGFWPKFGLAEVDLNTYERKIRKSGYHYMDLIAQERGN
jgi:beta-glucosidase